MEIKYSMYKVQDQETTLFSTTSHSSAEKKIGPVNIFYHWPKLKTGIPNFSITFFFVLLTNKAFK